MNARSFLLVLLIALFEQTTYASPNLSASDTAASANPQLIVAQASEDAATSSTASIQITAPVDAGAITGCTPGTTPHYRAGTDTGDRAVRHAADSRISNCL